MVADHGIYMLFVFKFRNQPKFVKLAFFIQREFDVRKVPEKL